MELNPVVTGVLWFSVIFTFIGIGIGISNAANGEGNYGFLPLTVSLIVVAALILRLTGTA